MKQFYFFLFYISNLLSYRFISFVFMLCALGEFLKIALITDLILCGINFALFIPKADVYSDVLFSVSL